MCSSGGHLPVASAIGFYFLLLASAEADVQQATPRSDGPYGLQSWTHQPMFVDEPRWILLTQRTPGQSSEDEADDHFWVTRGRKRYLHSPRPPIVLDRRVRLLFEDDDENSWAVGGKTGTLSSVLKNDKFWVNRGKRADTFSTDGENRAGFLNDEVHRGKREVSTEDEALFNKESNWANRDKKGDLTSALSTGDQFWVNRGKKDLQSLLESGDKFGVNRGKKEDLQSALNGGDKFWVNRGKKNDIQSLLNNGNDPFWVNRGKKNELQSMLNGGDPFWVNRGKKNELQSLLHNGDQFWVNRGKKNELQSVLNGGEPFWVNRGKKNELQSLLNSGDQFWVNRGKKNDLQSLLNNGDQFWVNRGKKSELQSMLGGGDQFWVNRGKKNELQSVLNGGEPFWVNRGKKNELQSLLNSGDQFWVNRGKKNELQSLLNNGDQFWVNRGKKSDVQSMLSGGDQFWVNRGKKNELQSSLNNGDQFWVNRGKRSDVQSILSGEDTLEIREGRNPSDVNIRGNSEAGVLTYRNYASPRESPFWSDFGWNDRLKKDPLKTILKPDPFFVNRGKKSVDKSEGNINETQSRDKQDERTKRQLRWERPLHTDNWLGKSKKTNDRPENFDPFWVTRGKRLEMHNRQRRDVTLSTTKTALKSTLLPRQKRMAKSPRIASTYEDYPYKKDSDVKSLLLWWKDKSAPGEMQDEEDILGAESLMMRRLGENMDAVKPFWINRGNKDLSVDRDEFLDEVPEKRRDALPSDVIGDLGSLTPPGETFWVARG